MKTLIANAILTIVGASGAIFLLMVAVHTFEQIVEGMGG
jgi:hypothetical protein